MVASTVWLSPAESTRFSTVSLATPSGLMSSSLITASAAAALRAVTFNGATPGFSRADRERGSADVVARDRDNLLGIIQEIEIDSLFEVDEDLLRGVEVVVERHPYGQLLAPDRRVGEVHLEEELLEYRQLRLGDAQTMFL